VVGSVLVIVLGREPSISNFRASMRRHFENARLLPTEYESVRTALSRGALHYLIKPFTAAELGERLRSYARYRGRLAAGDRLTQADVDRALGTLHNVTRGAPKVVKGQSPVTSRLVAEALRRAGEPRSAAEISEEVGISRATAQRYLASLAQAGRVLVSLRYGSTGRPEHEYVWSRPRPVA
jgi:response regulator of citrate/malate metabolism